MPLTTSTQLLKEAVAARRVIVAINVFSAESAGAVIRAAEDADAPVILSVNPPDLQHVGGDEIAAVVRVKAGRARVPVVLHLDHGMNLKTVVQCLRAGFTSIMIDPSPFSEEQGLAVVRTVVEICHDVGVPVESMVGKLRLAVKAEGEGDFAEELTDPRKAGEFAAGTGIDSLAVSVGTEHGSFLVGRPARIDMALLEKISRKVDVPLVIHGGSAVGDEQLRRLRRYRVGKMNIGSALRVAYRRAMIAALQEERVDVREASARAEEAMYEVVREKIRVLTL